MNLDGFCGISLFDMLYGLPKIMFVDFAGPKHHSVPDCITEFNISIQRESWQPVKYFLSLTSHNQ